jgi:hypothetical protein
MPALSWLAAELLPVTRLRRHSAPSSPMSAAEVLGETENRSRTGPPSALLLTSCTPLEGGTPLPVANIWPAPSGPAASLRRQPSWRQAVAAEVVLDAGARQRIGSDGHTAGHLEAGQRGDLLPASGSQP